MMLNKGCFCSGCAAATAAAAFPSAARHGPSINRIQELTVNVGPEGELVRVALWDVPGGTQNKHRWQALAQVRGCMFAAS